MPYPPKQLSASQRFFLALLLGAIGFAGNWFRFPLFFNVDLLFGSILVMLALQFCGLLPALLAAVITGSTTWLIWNHPYALIIFSCELLVTGMLYQRWRGNLMLANTVYWLLIGMPLAGLFYGLVMKVGSDGTTAIMFKQAINGMVNTIIARLIAIALQNRLRNDFYLTQPPSFRERITTLLALFVMVTALILLVLVSRRDVVRTEQQIINLLNAARMQTIALLATPCHTTASPAAQDHLFLQIQANAALKRIAYTLYDHTGKVVAANRQPAEPLPDKGGQMQSVADHIFCWVPDMHRNVSIMERWKRSVYLTKLPTPHGLLVIQTPVAPWLTLMYSNTTHILAATLALFLASLVPGIWISNKISQSLLRLGETTARLPQRIAAGEQPDWPDSSIPEVAHLTDDLRSMTSSLSLALAAEKKSLKLLKDESDKREQLETMLKELRIQERLRISRELHDDIGPSLQAIKLNLQLQYASCSNTGCQGGEIMQELVQSIELITANLRSVVSSLRQTSDDGLTLPESLQTMGEKLCQYTPVLFKLECNGTIKELSPETATALFFIAQEAVINAIRHGDPDKLNISLHVTSDNITLTIRDNGKGGATSSDGGSGLAIMQERARLIGGDLHLLSPAGKGTTITIKVPLS